MPVRLGRLRRPPQQTFRHSLDRPVAEVVVGGTDSFGRHGGHRADDRTRALVKRFDDFVAVDGIDVRVEPGEFFGFLGPNGAGKTSTMRMIGCVSPVTDGQLRVLGLNPATDGPEIRSRLGVVAQDDNLDSELTVFDNLIVYGRYFDLPRREIAARAEELLAFAQLTDRRGDDKVDPLSGGMKRRFTIARALVNRPELMLLDEPTTGLDPQARHLLWERLYQLKSEGVTQVLTTHYMDEAEQLCDRLVIMDQGRVVEVRRQGCQAQTGHPAFGFFLQDGGGSVVNWRSCHLLKKSDSFIQ